MESDGGTVAGGDPHTRTLSHGPPVRPWDEPNVRPPHRVTVASSHRGTVAGSQEVAVTPEARHTVRRGDGHPVLRAQGVTGGGCDRRSHDPTVTPVGAGGAPSEGVPA